MQAINGYQLDEKLYSGAHVEIYRGMRLQDQKKIIIKMPIAEHPSLQALASLQHEYNLLKQVQLPGIIKAYAYMQDSTPPFLVLEDIAGQSLQSYLNGQALDLGRFFQLALQLVDIINSLHQQHIIHKDIKPANIIIDPKTLNLKLTDLSISSQLAEEVQDYINPHSLEGTLAYLSPEQTGRMNRSIDYRTDFYSLGVTFYEMLTGNLPFISNDILELVHCHIAKQPLKVNEVNPRVPVMLAEIIAKLLAKMPEERYASMVGLKADLLECQRQWQVSGKVEIFTLGQQDIYTNLQISHKLYGRELELSELILAFDRVNEGSAELVLISGYSGVGKSSLVKEVHKPIAERKGYFIHGKFDQLQRSTPYSAFVDAIRGLVKQILAEPEESLQLLTQQLQSALGHIGQVIIDVVPDVEKIIGSQPAIPVLNPTESQNRFMLAFQNFIRVFAGAQHPLIMFLDDLQWADNASLKLMEYLLSDIDTRHLLIIGAYRSNEVDESHPLCLLEQALVKIEKRVQTLQLKPLYANDIQNLLADTLCCSMARVESLAELVQKKTNGNPFFINEFLKNLYQKHLLYFDYTAGKWRWDRSNIEQISATANVVDLLTVKIHQLHEDAQYTLKMAACIGFQFDLKTLANICNQPRVKIAQYLWQATTAGLIRPLNESYKLAQVNDVDLLNNVLMQEEVVYQFIHDQIQQAAYMLIAEATRAETHYIIGKLLITDQDLTEQHKKLFDILDHFNKGSMFVIHEHEKLMLAQANLWAGKRAKSAAAYQASLAYLAAGISLLPNETWVQYYDLTFNLNKELAECTYLAGNYVHAEEYFHQLIPKIKSNLEKVEVYRLYVAMLSTQNKLEDALNVGLQALKLLSIKVPSNPTTGNIIMAVATIKWLVGRRDVKNIQLPSMTDETAKAGMKLLVQLIDLTFFQNQLLLVFITCKLIQLSLRYGHSEETPYACLTFAYILLSGFKRYHEAFSYVEIGNNIRQYYPATTMTAREEFALGAFLNIWKYPITVCLDNLRQGNQAGLESGDILYANYCLGMNAHHAFLFGKPLIEVSDAAQYSVAAMNKYKIAPQRTQIEHVALIAKSFYEESAILKDNSNAIVQLCAEMKNKSSASAICSYYTKFWYITEDFNQAIAVGQYNEDVLNEGGRSSRSIVGKIYYALSITALFESTDKKQQKIFLKKLSRLQKQIQRWAKWSPINFAHYNLLFSAELARIHGARIEAGDLYDQAIKIATENNCIHLVAIANECSARFYAKLGKQHLVKHHLIEAYYAYERWGALIKCKVLEKSNPQVFQYHDLHRVRPLVETMTTAVTVTSNFSLDFMAVLKSTQAISSEIQLDKLLERLLQIVLEEAGAQRSVLLMKKDEQWLVEAESDVTQHKIYLQAGEDIKSREDLPITFISYVSRTQESIVIQDSTSTEQVILQDSYVQRVKPKSLMVLPVVYQGQLRRILYVEHHTLTNAFTAEHLQSLQLLISQAAISLENAYLYYQATHDPLTGLANRNLLYQTFQQSISRLARQKKQMAILFCDLDYFKTINDTLGHDVGDKLLQYFAEQLKGCIREGDLAVRLGGDEFVMLLEDFDQSVQVRAIADRLYQLLATPIKINGHEIRISSSMGISIYPKDGEDISLLLKKADTALYRAKEKGKNQYQFYSDKLNEQLKGAHAFEISLQEALERDEFCLYYQPIYNLETNQISSLEALIRWQHPERGLLTAGQFIQQAEQTPFMAAIEEWVINAVCQQAKIWSEKGLLNVPIAVNVSALQFKRKSLSTLIQHSLQETQLDPRFLELEFTESALIENNQHVQAEIEALKALGLRMIIDDFGTGYSSLAYLKRLPVSKLKIDKSFVQDVEHDEYDRTIIEAIIAMAHRLKLKVVAEGVEDATQLQFLQQQNVDAVQGYYFNHPLNVENCEAILREATDVK